jgi:hypothetical protein
MINLLDSLNVNLQLHITQLITDNPEPSQDVKTTITALISNQQRLDVLKEITESIKYIVNYSGRAHIDKMNKYATSKTMDEFKDFFNKQLAQLQLLTQKLGKKFPAREEKLEEERKIIEADAELSIIQEDINDLRQNATAIARERQAQRSSRENTAWWNSLQIQVQSWSDIGLNMTHFASENLGKYGSALTDFATSGPLGFFDGILKFLNNILYKILTNPSGWVIIISGLIVLQFTLGGVTGTIRIFRTAGGIILTITIGPIVFVYKIVKTGFGNLWSHLTTLVVGKNIEDLDEDERGALEMIQYGPHGKENYDRFIAQQEEGELYTPEIKYGGKYKKTGKNKKTRKNKKRRTRKLKNGKRRQTKHRRMRPTKRI